MVSLMLLAGSVWAGTIVIPLTGLNDGTVLVDPGRQWTDDDGIIHVRGMVRTYDVQGQDADGVPFSGVGEQVLSYNLDPMTGSGDLMSHEYGTVAYGDLEGNLFGIGSGTIAGFLTAGTFNYPHCTGDFAGWHYRGTWTGAIGVPTVQWEGYFHIPGGRNKAAAVEANTWGAVKALYR